MGKTEGARGRLVAAGAAAMRESGGRPLPDLVADEVVQRSGVPKSTLYQLWSSFDDFRREVLVELLRTAERQDPAAIMDAAVPVLERGGMPGEFMRAGSAAYFEQFMRSDTCRWLLAAYPHRGDEAIRREIASTLNGVRDRFSRPLALLIAASHRRPLPNLDANQIATLLVGLFVGMAVRERLDPGSATREMPWFATDGTPEVWPRIAVASQAIILRCTEEVNG